jgi:hypothetical protein
VLPKFLIFVTRYRKNPTQIRPLRGSSVDPCVAGVSKSRFLYVIAASVSRGTNKFSGIVKDQATFPKNQALAPRDFCTAAPEISANSIAPEEDLYY